eukprot:gnl/TRDRNA2_/TRDRNA2_202972_c0_seq1.p1 gnl/TRDRNA2_/TRDRNA2_202972_c0~~gnl/TRDRNA2_/TRDRNA2_202972_c0_seq1.p1  ORF type:complete len:346 (+),score=13.33 gnl/TRDRNA2_/TRDRNA2_202972_c0_seq1:117-1154(+)
MASSWWRATQAMEDSGWRNGAGWRKQEPHWKPYDFVEIGTSDFRTLTQFLDGSDLSCPLGHALRSWAPSKAVGLAVDPVEHLLRRLPKLPGVQTVPVAIGSTDGYATLHCTREDASWRYPMAYSAWLGIGTGRIRSPHPHLQQWLHTEGVPYDQVVEKRQVPVWSFRKLVMNYGVSSIDILKTDCEGSDCDVLQGVIEYCDEWPQTFPRIICFETNELSDERTVQWTIEQLQQRGYRVLSQGRDTTLKRSSAVPLICCDFLDGSCMLGEACFFDHPRDEQPSSRSGHSPACCYGPHCIRGHGGVVPTCCVCGTLTVHTRCCWCDTCWEKRQARQVHKERRMRGGG